MKKLVLALGLAIVAVGVVVSTGATSLKKKENTVCFSMENVGDEFHGTLEVYDVTSSDYITREEYEAIIAFSKKQLKKKIDYGTVISDGG